MTALHTPAALVYRFFPRTGPEAPVAQAALESGWAAITGQLGCTATIAALGVPSGLPADWARRGGSRLVAAAEHPHAPGITQAWVRVEHEICGLLVMLAPPGGGVADAWNELDRRLDEVLGPPDGCVGAARIFLALADGAPVRGEHAPAGSGSTDRADGLGGAIPTAVVDEVAKAVPGTPAVGWRWKPDAIALPRRAPKEAATAWLWELAAGAEDRVVREFVLVAAGDAESELDHLVWTTGGGSLTPLGRHLLHAAVLRYELRVFADGRDSGRVQAELDEVEDLLAGAGPDAADVTARLSRASVGVASLSARTTWLAEAVEITRDNLVRALGARLLAEPAAGPAGADRQLADWLQARIEEDRARLHAAGEQAGRLARWSETIRSSGPTGLPARPAAADRTGISAFVCYIHDSATHKQNVLRFAEFLVDNGIRAELDQWVPGRQDWYAWALDHISNDDFVLVIASPQCRVVGDGAAPPDRNRGGQSELAVLRDLVEEDRETWIRKILPVILPGGDVSGIPRFLQPRAADRYRVHDYSVAGADYLIRTLTGQPAHRRPPLGPVPRLPLEGPLPPED